VHLAGTNGKSSTARMISALVAAHGLKPGLFTSPHLQAVEERFAIGLEPMGKAQFAEALAELAPIADLYEERSGDPVTYFELTAALAYAWFAAEAVDAAIVETGLGGRLDATNAARSDVAVVTSIGIEHVEYLGDTVEAIAGEKLAILDTGTILVTGHLPPQVEPLAARRAEQQGAGWFHAGRDFHVASAAQAVGGWLVDVEGVHGSYHDLHVRLHGRHQTFNLAVAIASLEALLGRSLEEDAVREAAAAATVPGRMEVVAHDPVVMLDGAHNPHGAAALGAALGEEFPTTQWRLVLGVMRDKDLPEMLAPLRGRVVAVETAAADMDRSAPPDEIAAVCERALGVPARAHPSVEAALRAARDSGDPVLVAGSLYLVGEARDLLDLT
jgi:dihydrofolate synthase/folylpolyglutamate synthase